MAALPHGAMGGGFRMTEQGETIAQKYANLANATCNLASANLVLMRDYADLVGDTV